MGYTLHIDSASYPLDTYHNASVIPSESKSVAEIVSDWPPKLSSQNRSRVYRASSVASTTTPSRYAASPIQEEPMQFQLVFPQQAIMPHIKDAMNTLNADSTPHFPDFTWESYVNDLPETPKVRRKPAPKYPPGLGLGAAVTRPTPSRTQTFGITKHDPRRISNPRDILYHTPRPLTPEQQAKLAALKKQYENSPSIGSPLRDSSYIEQLNRLKAVYEKRESAGVLSAFHRNHDEGLRFLPYCRQGKCIDRTQKRCTYCKSEASDEAKGLYRARVFRIMEAAAQEAFEDPWDSCLRMKTRQDYLAFARYCENASKVVYTALDGIDLCPIAEIEVVFGDFDEEWIAKFWRAMKRRYEVDEEEERKQRAERKRVNKMLKEEEKENVAV